MPSIRPPSSRTVHTSSGLPRFRALSGPVQARSIRKSAYQGRYEIRGTKINYWDDTGFTADGEFIEGVLHHGGMLFYREGK
ncbi:Atu4866 domain-containing protein [Microvirga arabica]|nr:Atu4866 domain-containing protein [Microvirga arabica]